MPVENYFEGFVLAHTQSSEIISSDIIFADIRDYSNTPIFSYWKEDIARFYIKQASNKNLALSQPKRGPMHKRKSSNEILPGVDLRILLLIE